MCRTETYLMTDTHDSGRSAASAPFPLDAGVTLKATEALAGQETWTREQVAYVVALAYWSGAGVTARHDALELAEFAHAAGQGHPWPSAEQRVQARIRVMEQRHELVMMRWRGWPPVRAGQRYGLETHDHRGRPIEPRVVPVGEPCDPDVEWPEVAMPGGGMK